MEKNYAAAIQGLCRYPVKSMQGEALQKVRMEFYGLRGDRSHALIDETKAGWERYFTARQIPEMLGYRAELIEGGSKGDRLKIQSLDGGIWEWNDDFLQEMQTYSVRKMTRFCPDPQSSDLLAVDSESVLIVTDASLRRLEQMWGKQLDKRRFRANLLLSLPHDTPFIEAEWIGRRLYIGRVELKVISECERCAMITLDPETSQRDKSLLETVMKERNTCFGVYASVVKTGELQVGDPVYIGG